MQKERKPDLGGPNFDELEKKVKDMLEPVVNTPAEPPAPGATFSAVPEVADTDAVVDDIVAHESDDLLAAEDKELNQAFSNTPLSLGQKMKRSLNAWRNNPKARWLTIGALLIIVCLGILIPATRYAALNSMGVRSSSTITVLDSSTQQPLKNVSVTMAGKQGVTDENGKVSLSKLRLGKTNLVIEKKAFAQELRPMTLGWGSNPLGDVSIKPVGTQYSFMVTDYLSGKPLVKAEAFGGEADAISDEKGQLKLTVDKNAPATLEVVIKKDGYRDQKIQVNNNKTATQTVKMVSQHAQSFITKRSGKYDVYKVDIDGANEKLVLAGTGKERDDLALIPHAASDMSALVSTRENKHNSDGYLLSNLVLINLSDNSTNTIVESERIQVLDWSGDNLVFAQIAAGSSAASPKRHRLTSYNTKTNTSKEIAASNYFNDVTFANGKLFYAPSSNNLGGGLAGLYKVTPDGTDRQTVLPQEVWNIFRTSYDHLTVSQQQHWFDYKLGNVIATKLPGEPANPVNRLYVDSPDGKHSLWVDSRDGKGVLINYDVTGDKDTILKTQSGLTNPVYWIDDHTVVYRIKTPQETADYALSIDGGDPHKLKDVSNAAGIGTWYYY